MAYLNVINQHGDDNVLSGFGTVIINTDAIGADKELLVPYGYDLDSGIALKVVFTNGHNCVDASTPLTVKIKYADDSYIMESGSPKEIAVKVNQYGTLVNLPIHNISSTYKCLDPNTVLEMYYNGTDFVVIGNPLVLSSADYEIYANGYVEGGNVGDVKAISYSTIPNYGWLECNGQVVLQSDYPQLYQKFSDDNLLTVYNANHTGLDTTTQFAIPDYREVALVGVGQNDSEGTALATHDIYTVGQFKDDLFKSHSHRLMLSPNGTEIAYCAIYSNQAIAGGTGTTYAEGGNVTRGKRKGVKYCIKVF